MFCQKCGKELAEAVNFCSQCGHSQKPGLFAREIHAGFWKRLAAFLLDSLFLYLFSVTLLQLVLAPFFPGFMDGLLQDGPSLHSVVSFFTFVYIILIWSSVLFIGVWLYYTLFESSKYQATPGKLIVGIAVSDKEGHQISFGRATGRFFAKYLSFMTLGIGFLMAAFTENKQGLHDLISDTYVLNKSKLGK